MGSSDSPATSESTTPSRSGKDTDESRTTASASDTKSTLPVPVETTREYIRVRPSEEPLGIESVEMQLRRLHQVGQATEDTSLLHSLFARTDPPPTIEVLLLSNGETGESLSYLFGVDSTVELGALERILRALFPQTYELERTHKPETFVRTTLTETHPGTVTYHGHPERRQDWQTSLTPFSEFESDTPATDSHVPLESLVEILATSDVPMVYQALIQPKPDWTSEAETRRLALESAQETLGDQLATALLGSPTDETELPASDKARIEELAQRETRRSFVVNARLGLATSSPKQTDRLIDELASAFADVSHTTYEIAGVVASGTDAEATLDAMTNRTVALPTYDHWRQKLPWTGTRSPGIVADATEVGNFCLLGGEALTNAGTRALSPTPGERTALPRPPFEQLDTYRGDGLLVGNPLTADGTPDANPLVLPPSLQPLHVGWFGKTGSGKSTSLINAILANHAATEGASILIDPKGDGMANEYLRAHHATYGTLDDVIYFDCSEVLPAFSFFDIRDELDAGVPRPTAVEDSVDHYIEILTQIMGKDRFEQAVRSPDIIRYLTKAMFDPVNGDDAFAHSELHTAVRQMHERQTAPPVADEDLESMLAGVVANRPRSFDEIMQGVANRMEKITIDQRLARIFNHVADEEGPHFDLAEYLNEDIVIIIETGELRSEAQRVLTLVILSNLWTALRRRSQRTRGREGETDTSEGDTSPKAHPKTPPTDNRETLSLVNLYIEEAASVAVSDLLKDLLAQSRSFGCSVTLAMQFPGQMRRFGDDIYDEVLNNVSTVITGNVPADRKLAERLATDEFSPEQVGNRLRALRRGQWLVNLPAGFDEPEPRPFLIESAGLPPGHPDGEQPLSETQQQELEDAIRACRGRTQRNVGLTLGHPSVVGAEDSVEDTESETEDGRRRVDTALAQTNRLPPTVQYLDGVHGLRCSECENRYDPYIDGMKRAIECCSSLEAIDRDDIPICAVNLKLTAEERAVSDWTDTQLMFLQAVYNAQQLRYDSLEYDLLTDSMIRLQEYINIPSDALQDLIDADLLSHDTDHPHRLYTVTPAGRSVIGESYRLGVDYGHGAGDLEESSQHVFAVEVGRQYLLSEYAQDPDSAVVEVIPYYDLDRDETLSPAAFMGSGNDAKDAVEEYEQRRLDVAGVDADGEVIVAIEAERVNNDVKRAVPDDFDKIAECGVEEAIWIVMTQSAGHDVLGALNAPLEGPPRVEKTYAKTTPPQQFRIETPGMTAMYPVEWLRDRISEFDR